LKSPKAGESGILRVESVAALVGDEAPIAALVECWDVMDPASMMLAYEP